MTDRHCGYLVTLEQDTRDDDAEVIVAALGMIKGVLSVTPIVTDLNQALANERARADLWQKLWRLLCPKDDARS